MSRNLHLGAASISFSQPLYIESTASIVSQKEADGPLGDFFDLICKDPMFGCGTWESAESTLQKETATLAMNKAGLDFEDIHLMFAGDLLAQTAATCFGSAGLGIPFYGLYGACSTMGESLSLGCLALTAGFGTRVLCATSSHFASAEKEFRFPLGYGNQRPFSATWTVTGSGACILNTAPPGEKSPLRSGNGCAAITGLTAGRVMDYGLKDSMNMADVWLLLPVIPLHGTFRTSRESLRIMMLFLPEIWESSGKKSFWIFCPNRTSSSHPFIKTAES